MANTRMSLPRSPAAWVLVVFCALLAWVRNEAAIDPGLSPSQIAFGLLTVALAALAYRSIKEAGRVGFVEIALWGAWGFSWLGWSGALDQADGLYALSKAALSPALLGALLLLIRAGQLERSDLLTAGSVFALAVLLPALANFVEVASGGHLLEDIYSIKGSMQHKNLLSGALLLGFIFSAAAALQTGNKAMTWIGGAALIAIFVLRTRGVWLGVGLGLISSTLLFLVFHRARWSQIKLSGFWKVIGALAILTFVSSLFLEAGQSKLLGGDTLNLRLAYWKNTLKMLAESPWTGIGPMNWRIHFVRYGLGETDYNVMNGITAIQRPHNDYLWILAEQGWIGLVLFLAAFGAVLISAVKAVQNSPDVKALGLSLIAFGGFVAFAVFSFGDFPSERSPHSVLWIMLWAYILSSENGAAKTFTVHPSVSRILSVVGLLAGLWGVYSGMQRLEGERLAKTLLEAHSKRDVRSLIVLAPKVANSYYALDNFSNPFAYYGALGLFAEGKVDEAERGFREALELHPWHLLSLKQLGDIEKKRSKPEKALEFYERCLEISPLMEPTLLNKAEVLHAMGRSVDAFHSLNRCTLRIQNPKFDQLASSILPAVLKSKAGDSKQSELYRRLEPWVDQPEKLVAAYRAYRLESWQNGAQRARSGGKKE